MIELSRWDIFCRVVDNFGDIGVCARLARQLAHEYGLVVRLWVDDLASFKTLCPEVDVSAACQRVAGIEVRHWRDDTAFADPAGVVIEAFGCGLPEAYLKRLNAQSVWVNLEYLSAEPWVADFHGLSSQSAGAPVRRTFFFPGFGPGTGGLLRERGLIETRQAYQLSHQSHPVWCAARPDALRVTLFCYDNPALPALLAGMRHGPRPVCCAVPAGAVAQRVEQALSGAAEQGGLQIVVFDFLPQPDYDRLLWSADCNFVRGEDSFVRAQWAARPFVWQIYPQDERAHLKKLEAFLDRYCAAMPASLAEVMRDMTRGWNEGRLTPEHWARFASSLPALAEHAEQWCAALAAHRDLTDTLVQFCTKSL